MNTTLTTERLSTRQMYGTSHPIGDDTENVAFNLPKRALYVLKDFLRGKNRSAFIRRSLAETMQREDTWSGLAFRAAIGLRDFAKSIFTPNLPPAEKAAILQDSASATEPATNPAEKMIEDFTAVQPNGEYELSKD